MDKLYYKCPIEAAYMAKNFGVRFEIIAEDVDTKKIEHHEVEGEANILTAVGKLVSVTIHPDSLSVFEPQKGDLVALLNDKGSGAIEFISTNTNITYLKDLMRKSAKIIQRNGKAFIMPEVENA